MTKPLIDLPSNSLSPLSVHINRNGFKESFHQVDVAVCDADGSVILGMGDLESVIFPRSAMKPLQSIALIVASVYVCVNLAADLLTMMANPKLRTMYTMK